MFDSSLMSVARRSFWTALVAVVCALGGAFVALGSAPSAAFAETCKTAEAAFESTGAQQCYEVPAGVSVLSVTAVGAKGGEGLSETVGKPGASGGFGGLVGAQLTVTPGHTLYVEVGSNGCQNKTPECTESVFGGGGAPGGASGSGGGASDVREKPAAEGEASLLSRLLVAAGGGGGGKAGVRSGSPALAGGPGGSGDAEPLAAGGAGGNGATASSAAEGGEGGKGATKTGGGKGGKQGVGGFLTLSPGHTGELGAGGSGAGGGGGGGGGLYGGGAGGGGGFANSTEWGANGGGGAGSSFVAPSGSNPTFATDTTGTPRVKIAPVLLPTSKEQCKKGGWKNFGTTFKNQGQCVKFVEAEKHLHRHHH